MGIAAFVLLTLVSAIVIALPLVRQHSLGYSAAVTHGVIDRAVQERLRARRRGGLRCPECDREYEAGDRFCVGCGVRLPISEGASGALTCPVCSASIREGDRFCSKCGATAPGQEAA